MHLKVSRELFNENIIKINIWWAFFAPIVLAAILSFANVRGLFILKDLVFYSSLLLVFFIGRSKGFIFYIFRILVFIIYLFLTTSLFFELHSWIIYNLRQLIVPILIIGFGYYIKIEEQRRLASIVRFLYKTSIWVVFLGIVFRVIDMWSFLDLTNYFNLKGIPVDKRGLSYMFYEPALSYTERMVSTVLDPISLGHMLAAPLILCYYSVYVEGKKRKRILIILAIGLILTFSKGAILQVILALFFFNKKLSPTTRFLIPSIFVAMALFTLNIEGILIHLFGLKNAIVYLNLFGHGLGMVGNYAKMFADDLSVYYKFEISDTFIGSVIGQIGLIGFAFWISFFLPKIRSIILSRRNHVGAIVLTSQLIIAAISENTFNFTSFIVPGIISGILIKNQI
tara:strand:+ start:6495 stop:7685 length:1191 start_codon:yes stop_codon:yes gene_type:complete